MTKPKPITRNSPELPTLRRLNCTFSQNEAATSAINLTRPWSIHLNLWPSRPCLGLHFRFSVKDQKGQDRGRIQTEPGALKGRLRTGELSLDITVPHMKLPPGRYKLQLKVFNFATTLASVDLDSQTFKGDWKFILRSLRGRHQIVSASCSPAAEPDPDPTLKPATRLPWERERRPVWAYRNYREKLDESYEQQPLMLHIHIPKCGGTTFRREILEQWFPDPASRAMVRDVFVSNYVERDELFCAPPELIERLLLISGHDSFGAVPEPKKEMVPVCFFRDPFDRAASLWTHHVEKSPTSFGNTLKTHYRDQQDFQTRSDVMFDIWRSFLDVQDLLQLITMPRSRKPGREIRDVYKGYYERISTLAQSRIDALPFVLLTERFDESLVYMHLNLGKPLVRYQRHRVHRPEKSHDELAAHRRKLSKANPSAAEFYNQLIARFDRQIAETEGFNECFENYQSFLKTDPEKRTAEFQV